MAVYAFNGAVQGTAKYEIVSSDDKVASGYMPARQASRPAEGQPPFRAKLIMGSGVFEKWDIPDNKLVVLGTSLVDL